MCDHRINEIKLILIERQCNKCFYCNREMNRDEKSPQLATVEHLIDKWSSPKHKKINESWNLVAACFECNNTRGNVRNIIARNYYKVCAVKKNMKLIVASTPSSTLFKLFGPVPQQLFNVKETQNA